MAELIGEGSLYLVLPIKAVETVKTVNPVKAVKTRGKIAPTCAGQ